MLMITYKISNAELFPWFSEEVKMLFYSPNLDRPRHRS
jgi:hypothetical protein